MALEGSEDQLDWEARQRTPAAIAAAVAALFTFVGTVWRGLTLSDLPRNGLMESLGRAAEPGPIGGLDSLRIKTFEYYHDQATAVLVSSIVVSIGYVALGWALTYLAAATRARRPAFPKLLVYVPLVAATPASARDPPLGDRHQHGDQRLPRRLARPSTPRGTSRTSSFGVFASLLGLPGRARAGARAGHDQPERDARRPADALHGRARDHHRRAPGPALRRPAAGGAVLLAAAAGPCSSAGAGPSGQPPAWRTGNAEPWPSSAEVREQRQRAAAERRGEVYEPPEPEPEPAAVVAGPSPSASARKRKRKRR